MAKKIIKYEYRGCGGGPQGVAGRGHGRVQERVYDTIGSEGCRDTRGRAKGRKEVVDKGEEVTGRRHGCRQYRGEEGNPVGSAKVVNDGKEGQPNIRVALKAHEGGL